MWPDWPDVFLFAGDNPWVPGQSGAIFSWVYGKPMMDGNLFAELAGGPGLEERFEELCRAGSMRVERIVSTGQASPPGFWYDQELAEWVVLLTGAAELHFEDEAQPRRLQPGDWVVIAPHRRHRVHWTDPTQPSLWLAIHYRPEQ